MNFAAGSPAMAASRRFASGLVNPSSSVDGRTSGYVGWAPDCVWVHGAAGHYRCDQRHREQFRGSGVLGGVYAAHLRRKGAVYFPEARPMATGSAT
jgi:hypothetical protein